MILVTYKQNASIPVFVTTIVMVYVTVVVLTHVSTLARLVTDKAKCHIMIRSLLSTLFSAVRRMHQYCVAIAPMANIEPSDPETIPSNTNEPTIPDSTDIPVRSRFEIVTSHVTTLVRVFVRTSTVSFVHTSVRTITGMIPNVIRVTRANVRICGDPRTVTPEPSSTALPVTVGQLEYGSLTGVQRT